MTVGTQDERMRATIAFATEYLVPADSEKARVLCDDALARARTFLRDAVGDEQEGPNAMTAADRAAVLAFVRAAADADFPRSAARSAAAKAYHRPRGTGPDSWDA